ncbi:hypothetical protein K1X76_07085 [bacterium]|nr:hypothetical protein [bacterium]
MEFLIDDKNIDNQTIEDILQKIKNTGHTSLEDNKVIEAEARALVDIDGSGIVNHDDIALFNRNNALQNPMTASEWGTLAMFLKKHFPSSVPDIDQSIFQAPSAFMDGISQVMDAGLLQGNRVYSASSEMEVLLMLFSGLSNDEYQKVAERLGLNMDIGAQLEYFKKLRDNLEQTQGATLNMASRLFAAPGYLKASYKALFEERFDTNQASEVNFAKAPAKVRTAINEWVKKQTNGMILELLKPSNIDASTSLVLVSALYFKGKWKSPFDPAVTTRRDFTTGSGSKVSVPMMHQTSRLPYTETDSYQAVRLDYGNGDISMVVLLPRDGADFKPADPDFRGALDGTFSKRPDNVYLDLPRFRVNTRLDLKDAGWSELLSSNFPAMTDQNIQDVTVISEVMFQVDEKGAEGAAATAAMVTRGGFMGHMMQVDRPFYFAVMDHDTGTIIFRGHIDNPTL